MPFSVGDRLSRFEITGLLGAGGMGEVYRARDPHLQRDVAIKVLPEEFSQDASRRRRFEQEARAAGGLNHPNILAVYDVGVQEGCLYIVTELLEGETLGARLARGVLTPRRAAELALQIARGLAAAHDRGLAHRDVKPGNLFITCDGRLKILDFGLAKIIGPDSGATETITVEGVARTPVLGSVTYMSPEQVRGVRVDHRTDIFSFGVVLYEMLAGFPPFRRGSSGDTLNAILHDDPPALPTGDGTLRVFGDVVRRCLAKMPDERYASANDLLVDLEAAQRNVTRASRRPRSRTILLTAASVVAIAAAAAAGAFIAMRLTSSQTPPPVYRIRTMTNLVGLEESPAISPDGRMLAFTGIEGQRRQIFIRYLSDSPLSAVTSDDADHETPRWLPDGTSLVYFSPAGRGEVQGAIYRIPALGGAPQKIMSSIGGGDVNREGRLTCFRLENERIQLVTAAIDGTDVRLVAQLQAQHYEYPRWSPDNQRIAFQAGDGYRSDVYVVEASGQSEPRRITQDGTFVKGLSWLPDARGIVYASARASTFPYLPPLTLWEARLDGRQRQLTTSEESYEQPDVHASGLISASRVRVRYDIWEYPFAERAEPVGSGRQLTRQTGQVSTPSVAPDGREVAYLSDHGDHTNVWVTSPGALPRQVTFEKDAGVAIGVPSWSPDGQWISYLSSGGNLGFAFGVWLVRPDGSDNHRLLTKGLSPAWSSDSKWIYYVESASASIQRIAVTGGASEVIRSEPARNIIGVHDATVYYVVDRGLIDGRQQFEIRAAPTGPGPARVITTIPASRVPSWQIVNPALSTDGQWLAQPLTDGFTTNIWAIATSDGRLKQITNYGDRPIFIARRVSWSADGRSILAAIGEGDADVVMLDELIPARSK